MLLLYYDDVKLTLVVQKLRYHRFETRLHVSMSTNFRAWYRTTYDVKPFNFMIKFHKSWWHVLLKVPVLFVELWLSFMSIIQSHLLYFSDHVIELGKCHIAWRHRSDKRQIQMWNKRRYYVSNVVRRTTHDGHDISQFITSFNQ